MLSLYWFGFCHYVLRSWPWIVVGLASLVYFPALVDGEQGAYVKLNVFCVYTRSFYI